MCIYIKKVFLINPKHVEITLVGNGVKELNPRRDQSKDVENVEGGSRTAAARKEDGKSVWLDEILQKSNLKVKFFNRRACSQKQEQILGISEKAQQVDVGAASREGLSLTAGTTVCSTRRKMLSEVVL